MSAHKLALHDLGKAIAINPVGGDNYYLRGDCHSKLGNYEQVRARAFSCVGKCAHNSSLSSDDLIAPKSTRMFPFPPQYAYSLVCYRR
jgi:hypothetical protein